MSVTNLPALFEYWSATAEAASADWRAIGSSGPAGDKTRIDEARLALETILSDLLECEHLAVLMGSGASLSVRDSEGSSIFPSMGDIWNTLASTEGERLDRVATAAKYVKPSGGDSIELLLSRCSIARELGVGGEELAEFITKAEATLVAACRKDPDSAALIHHQDLLRRLLQRGPRRSRLEIFTTNYDRCVEQSAELLGAVVLDGFSFASTPHFTPDHLDLDVVHVGARPEESQPFSNVVRLFKLHGSVDWAMSGRSVVKQPTPIRPLLIYPRGNKYELSYSQPFLEMMARFQGCLRRRNVGLLVVGCGFNDSHIAEPLLAAVRSNAALRLVVVAPDLSPLGARTIGDETSVAATKFNAYLRELHELILRGDRRIALVAARLDQFTPLFPMSVGETGAALHAQRVKEVAEQLGAEQSPGEGGGKGGSDSIR